MRNKLFVLLLLFQFSILFSQEVTYYDNNSLRDSLITHENGLAEYFFFKKNGRLFFYFKEFYGNDHEIVRNVKEYYLTSENLQYERITDKSFNTVGMLTAYYENGQIEHQCNHNKKYEPIGKCYNYYEDGTPLSQTNYNDDGKMVLQKNYNWDGSLFSKFELLESESLYKVNTYFDNGNIKVIRYENMEGSYIGLYKEYHEDGKQIFEIGEYSNEGKKNGKWKYYRENGSLWWEERYKTDETYNHSMYFENGQLKSVGIRTYLGNKIGVWTSYDKYGNVINVRDYGYN